MNQLKKNNIKNIVVITINATQNNTLILAKGIMGNFIGSASLGMAIKNKRGKGSVLLGAQISSEILLTKLLELGYLRAYIKVKGFGRGRDSALFGLASSDLIVEHLIDVTPMPHNGCRLKKSRRI
jgi:small subunit ribosomal protein S11